MYTGLRFKGIVKEELIKQEAEEAEAELEE